VHPVVAGDEALSRGVEATGRGGKVRGVDLNARGEVCLRGACWFSETMSS
jgi:hypothetical protein